METRSSPINIESIADGNEGKVFTKHWIVCGILDLIGYVASERLYDKTILEPSCGDGNFLIEIVERLLRKSSFDHISEERLKNSILAFDIDKKSLEACKRRVVKLTKQYGYSSSLADGWIFEQDFLLSNVTNIDYVVGNPPYIRAKEIPVEKKKEYIDVLETFSSGTDIYIGFFEKGLKCLKKGGTLCYICSDRWTQNAYGKKLRNFLWSGYSIDSILRLTDVDAFEDNVTAYPSIFQISKKGFLNPVFYAECSGAFDDSSFRALVSEIQSGQTREKEDYVSAFLGKGCFPPEGSWMLNCSRDIDLFQKMDSIYPSLEENNIKIGIGLATGLNKVFIVDDPSLVEPSRLLPTFLAEDIASASLPQKPCHWIVNPWDEQGNLVDLEKYPKLKAYFEIHEADLSKRFVSRRKPNEWFRTIDKPRCRLTQLEKLLVSDLRTSPMPYLDEGHYYPSHNFYWMVSDVWDLQVLGGILMSRFLKTYIGSKSVKMRGDTLRFQAQYLRTIHLPSFESISKDIRFELKSAFLSKDLDRADFAVKRMLIS